MDKYLIVYYPDDGYYTYIQTFKTFEELEKAVKDNYTGTRVVACKILE